MDHLGIGNHVANGQTALFLRVGRRDGTLLFQLLDPEPDLPGPLPFPHDSVLRMANETREEAADEHAEPPEGGHAFTPVTAENNWIEDGNDYLSSDEAIAALVDDLKAILGTGPPTAHCYHHFSPPYDWQCLGILDAAAKYQFPVRDYGTFRTIVGSPPWDTLDANSKILNYLQKALRSARKLGNEALAIQTAVDILEWGGTNRAMNNENAVRAASAAPGGFLGYLDLCQLGFGTGTSINLTPFIGSGYGIRSNAGFTKIYALAFDNFIIYDSRVAAALGLIIVRLLALRGHLNAPVPTSVAFRADNRGQPAQRRNPNSNRFNLTGFTLAPSGGDLAHLKWNIRANALLTRALTGSAFETAVVNNPTLFPVAPLRALEGALFMIGYDLGSNWPHHN